MTVVTEVIEDGITVTYDTETHVCTLSETQYEVRFPQYSTVLAAMQNDLGETFAGVFLAKLDDGTLVPVQFLRDNTYSDWGGSLFAYPDGDVPQRFVVPSIEITGPTADANDNGHVVGQMVVGADFISLPRAEFWIDPSSVSAEFSQALESFLAAVDPGADPDTGLIYLEDTTVKLSIYQQDRRIYFGQMLEPDEDYRFPGGVLGLEPGYNPGTYPEPPVPPEPPTPTPTYDAKPCPIGLMHPGLDDALRVLSGDIGDLAEVIASKQDTLTAGEGISIDDNVISVTGKQDTLTAGDNITIVDNVISAQGGGPAPETEVMLSSLDAVLPGDKIKVYFVDSSGSYTTCETLATAAFLEWTPPGEPQADTYCEVIALARAQDSPMNFAFIMADFLDTYDAKLFQYYDNSMRAVGDINPDGDISWMEGSYPDCYASVIANMPANAYLCDIMEAANDPLFYGVVAFSVITSDPSRFQNEPEPSH